jgi:hypothetical protein
VDTLVINKTGCAKVTCTNSLYVAGATQVKSGQLVLVANEGVPYKFVCEGDLDIAAGGGIALRKNQQGVAANMAIQGGLNDHNTTVDSSCNGISNLYNGNITLYRGPGSSGYRTISMVPSSSVGNLTLVGRPGAGFILGSNILVDNLVLSAGMDLSLGAYDLIVTGNIDLLENQQ